ncbi:nuclear nucleic acid-binding protein C1D-like [Oratosquilla oratoria]|uniref:nuclear nucleic acid-binding protein C1D-like n=1 Tax=Oratosquilla oratoria TaxID=337810 RepID=UPI003F757753
MSEDVGEAVGLEDFPPGMAPRILSMTKAVNQLEENLEQLVSLPSHEVHEQLSPVERAKLGMLEIYAINSLFWVLMKTSGEDVDQSLREDYKVEMGRLKEAQGRLSELEARAHRSTIDRQAAGRFIRRGLGHSTRRTEEEDNEGRRDGSKESQPNRKKRKSAVKEEEAVADRPRSSSVECIDVDASSDQEEASKHPKKTERNWYEDSWG